MSSETVPARKIERAVLATDDKTGLPDFARGLAELKVELWATRGTGQNLSAAGVPVRSIEELTGVAAWFDGRVKTLHPAVFGGILAPRSPAGLAELADRRLLAFDLVVVNFYPFERHVRDAPGATDREEFIDIGGVALARAAAKNHRFVTVVTDPEQYGPLLEEIRRLSGAVSPETRRRLAVRAFERCTEYDAAIVRGLTEPEGAPDGFPERVALRRDPLALRYGENPHQRAATYRPVNPNDADFAPIPLSVVKGASLSYTNLLDLDTALSIVAEFSQPAAAIVKHATPCGVAVGPTIHAALEQAIATDPVARYGCAIALNRPVSATVPQALKGVFVDLLAAPEIDPAALETLGQRPKLKLVRLDPSDVARSRWEAKSALGRVLFQEADRRELVPAELKRVAGTPAGPEELTSLEFAWRVVRHAKSNAIAIAVGHSTVGIGSGQPTRVKAVELACEVAGERARGAVLASDAFFPFPDGVEAAGRAGVRVIVQPGGSVRDPEVIATAERYGMSMYFTGWRVFRH
ncbi:MAG: bifunctional phosphoribosylaminoimidazolecarboxamide formyltransferase/IMP cyclohydrolase [Thermoplasmata archaeon]